MTEDSQKASMVLGDKTFYIYSVLDSILKARFWFGYEWAKQRPKRQEIIVCEQMLDGAPPQIQADLDAAGLGYMVNKNFGESRFQCRSVESNYWALNDVKNIAEFNIDIDDAKLDTYKLQNELADTWNKALKAWDSFPTKRQLAKSYVSRFGSCVIVFPDANDYHYEVIHPTNVVVPLETRNYVSDWYAIAVVHLYTPEKLWQIYRDDKAESLGWNKTALAELLLVSSTQYNNVAGSNGGFTFDQFKEFEAKL